MAFIKLGGETVQELAIREMNEQFARVADNRTGDSDELIAARHAAENGDCTELLKQLWPSLGIDPSDEDAKLLGRTVRLDDFQMDIINNMVSLHETIPGDPSSVISEVFVKGNTKAGKSCAMALGICLFYYVYKESAIILTSTSFEHVQGVLYAEVKRWFDLAVLPMSGNCLKEGISDDHNPKHYLKLANPEQEEGFAGHHSMRVMFVFDEATSVKDSRYTIAQTQAHKIVAAANPRSVSGWFRFCYPKNDPDVNQTIPGIQGLRRTITIDGAACANVKHRKKIIPGQMDYIRFEGLSKNDDPRWVAVFVHGKFPVDDPEKQLIMSVWLPRHKAAYNPDHPIRAFGLDVAASEAIGKGDSSYLACGGVDGCAVLLKNKVSDTMELVQWTISSARELFGIDLTLGQNPIACDTEGIGKGVCDRLVELGCWVIAHSGNAPSTVDPKRYQNLRAETYGELGRRLDPKGPWGEKPWGLPNDPYLDEELVAPEKIYQGSDGLRFAITPKDSKDGKVVGLRKRLGRSPDRADSVTLLYAAVRLIEASPEADASRIQMAYSTGEYKKISELTPNQRDQARLVMSGEVQNLLDFLTRPRRDIH